MTTALSIIGIITIIGGLVLGIMSGTFWGFITVIFEVIMISIIYFALAKVLENQENIKEVLQNVLNYVKKPIEKQMCSKCGKEYDVNLSSCPYCGHKS